MEPRDKQETTPSIASGEIVSNAGGEFGRHEETFTRRSLERNRETEIITNSHEILLFSVCIKSTIVVFNMAKQLSEENGGGPFC